MRFDAYVGDSYPAWSPNVSASRAINLYPEIVESAGAKSRVSYHSTPGLRVHCTLPLAPIRGLWAGEDRLFAAAGTGFYEVFADPDHFNNRGVIADDAAHTPVGIYPNGQQLFIVSADHAYIDAGAGIVTPMVANGEGTVNVTGGSTAVTWVSGDKFDASLVGNTIDIEGTDYIVASVTDPNHLTLTTPAVTTFSDVSYAASFGLTARTGAFLDSYFISNPPDSKKFFFSAPNNGLEWDALEVSVKESYPDNISAIFADHEELWLFGTHHSTEVWRNEGDTNAAGGFRRDPGGTIQMGLAARWSVCSLASGLHFLGGDTSGRTIAYRAQGFQPVRVSTHAVEQVWNTYSKVDDAYAYNYIEHGHEFWVLNFQTANATWVYDAATRMWHERAWWDGAAFQRHRGRCHAFVSGDTHFIGGTHFVGDWQNGQIYKMSQNYFDDYGSPLRRQRIAPYVSNEEKEVFHHRLQIDLEITGSAPAVTQDWSNDDGTTWSAARVRTPSRSDKKGRVVFRRLGAARDRLYRTTISAAVKVAIADAHLDVTPGTS